jgi:hypothetical protein
MEADWAVEIGADLPSIDIPWEGFIDLRDEPAAVQSVKEAIDHFALREALVRLNSKESPVFTAKCDVWTVTSSEIDPHEFDALAEDAQEGFASYIDVLQFNRDKVGLFAFHEEWVRGLTAQLRPLALPNGRVEFVIRAANVDSFPGYGVTVYAAGCGADASAAYASWQAVLGAAVAATMSLNPLTGE